MYIFLIRYRYNSFDFMTFIDIKWSNTKTDRIIVYIKNL